MNNLQSPLWLAAGSVSLALLLSTVVFVSVKGKGVIEQPSIQEVFTGEVHEFTTDLGQLLKVVPPTNYVATVPQNHGPQYRTVDWLKAQGSLAWTLQVMSSEDEEMVKSYLAQREDKEQFAYFMTREGEKVSYIAVYGNFVTMELALGVANTMDFGLPDGVRAGPEKFITYVPNVPLIQPAIVQPPPAKYGGVPEVPIVPEPSSEEAVSSSIEDETLNTPPVEDNLPVVDPF